jgi:hypothetical protein
LGDGRAKFDQKPVVVADIGEVWPHGVSFAGLDFAGWGVGVGFGWGFSKLLLQGKTGECQCGGTGVEFAIITGIMDEFAVEAKGGLVKCDSFADVFDVVRVIVKSGV